MFYFLNERLSKDGKREVVILSWISAICTLTSFAANLIEGYRIDVLNVLFALVSPLILLLYIFKCQKSSRATFLVPIAFYAGVGSSNSLFDMYISGFILIFIFAFAFGIMAFGALKGFENKKLILIPTIVVIIIELLTLIEAISYAYDFISFCSDLLGVVASISMTLALFVFGFKNNIPALIAKKERKDRTTEKELNLLKEKLDLGIITEEEYKEKRAEIIGKL